MTKYEASSRSFAMAMYGMVVCALLAALSTQAITIDARLMSFQSTDADLNSGGPAGGIGTFELLSDVTGTDVDFLGTTFLAQCLEPNEYVTAGNSYTFSVVDLAAAPTSRIGGMGAINAGWLERIMAGLGLSSVEDVAAASAITRSAVQMATYEAAFETSGIFDFSAGAATLTGAGLAVNANVVTALGAVDPLEGFALLNIGRTGAPATRSAFLGQDFAVYRNVEIPAPMPIALMGLGLLGIRRVVRDV